MRAAMLILGIMVVVQTTSLFTKDTSNLRVEFTDNESAIHVPATLNISSESSPGIDVRLECTIVNNSEIPMLVPRILKCRNLTFYSANGTEAERSIRLYGSVVADFDQDELQVLQPGKKMTVFNSPSDLKNAWDPVRRELHSGFDAILLPNDYYSVMYSWSIDGSALLKSPNGTALVSASFPFPVSKLEISTNPVIYNINR